MKKLTQPLSKLRKIHKHKGIISKIDDAIFYVACIRQKNDMDKSQKSNGLEGTIEDIESEIDSGIGTVGSVSRKNIFGDSQVIKIGNIELNINVSNPERIIYFKKDSNDQFQIDYESSECYPVPKIKEFDVNTIVWIDIQAVIDEKNHVKIFNGDVI